MECELDLSIDTVSEDARGTGYSLTCVARMLGFGKSNG
jgi:hypothetical protein